MTVERDSSLGQWIASLWWGVPIAWGLHQYAYRRIERYRLTMDRWAANLRNPTMQWGLVFEVDFIGSPDEVGNAAASAIEKVAPVKLLSKPDRHVQVFQVSGQVVQMKIIPPLDGPEFLDGAGQLRLSFAPTRNALRAWTSIIEDGVLPVVKRVEDATRSYLAVGSEPKITVEIVYGNRNPYFGYFVTRVEPSAVARVDIEYFERVAEDNTRVQVHEDRLEFVAPSLDSARRLSLRYLALGEPSA